MLTTLPIFCELGQDSIEQFDEDMVNIVVSMAALAGL